MNMNNLYQHILIVLLPLIITNVLHMLLVKKDAFQFLTKPIAIHLFGTNKTWRGLFFVSITNAFILMMLNYIFHLNNNHSFFLGFALGLAYILFELPNSYIKRRLGIQSGEQSQKNKLLFSLLDKTDSAFGVTFTYFLLGYSTIQMMITLFLCASLTHILFSKILVSLKIKKNF